MPGGVFLLNSIYGPEEVWDHIPVEVQRAIIAKKLRFYVIDAYEVAQKTGMGGRINTIMQTCFFAISGVLPREQAIAEIKHAIEKTYGKRGEAVVQRNFEAVDQTLAYLHEVKVPASRHQRVHTASARCLTQAPEFVRRCTRRDHCGRRRRSAGERLPSRRQLTPPAPPNGKSATSPWKSRSGNQNLCIQCGKCSFVCPHAVIREKVYDPSYLESAPEGWQSTDARWKEFPGMKYSLVVSPEDCTGCAPVRGSLPGQG